MKASDDANWRNQVISTLKLRHDALTTGELKLYRELMEQRGIPVPAWFTRIQMMVEKKLPIAPVTVPASWDGPTKSGSAEIARQTLKLVQDDHDRKYGRPEKPEFKTAVCEACRTETIMPYRDQACHWCTELNDVRRRVDARLASYEAAKDAARLHLPSLRWPRSVVAASALWIAIWLAAWAVMTIVLITVSTR